jgi:hypothetical protein
MSGKKREQGRPPKWEKFTNMMNQVLAGNGQVGNVIIFTDAELLDMVNERLPVEDRISITSFKRYKAGEIDDDGVLSVFVGCYKRALWIQKENILERLAEDVPGGWQKWAWIMERKFDDWNLRHKEVDETPVAKRLVLRVEKGSD